MDTTRIYTMSSGREFKRYFDQMDLVISQQKIIKIKSNTT